MPSTHLVARALDIQEAPTSASLAPMASSASASAPAASTTPVKWVASDHDGLPMKRKQVAQACDTCRKRKKRCVHTENSDSAGPSRPASRPGSADRFPRGGHPFGGPPRGGLAGYRTSSPSPRHPGNAPPANEDEEDATQVAANRLMELSSSRFISDLNPEGMFIQAAKPALPESDTAYRDKNDLGVWLPPGASNTEGGHVDDDEEDDDDEHNSATKTEKAQSGPHPHPNIGGHQRRRRSRNHGGAGGGPRSAISEAALAYERARYAFAKECLTIYPPDEDFAVLHRIYCEKVHPILPVLKDIELERASPSQSHRGTAVGTATAATTGTPPTPQPSVASTVFPTLLKQIMSLSAATTDGEAAAAHLRLEPNGPLLTPREFHHRLTDAVFVVLNADLIGHRFDYIRATILLSFFYQPSAEVDRNKPSFLFTQAAHHFQTIGAHLLGYRPEQPDDDVERVFCALWALDRLVGILYARPCMMHAYDNGKNPEDCIVKQPPCFRLFMSVMLWLDKVLHLYRPRQPFVMIDIPVYEALILDAQAEKLPSVLLATIEVLYHTACVLSCRQPLSAFTDVDDSECNGTLLNRDDRTYLPISIMNPRRSHSSDRIVWVTQTQPICLFPFVPYAVSIALSVQYKKMRYSRTPLFRTRARVSFKDIVALLKSMGDVFINARVNAALGESIWKQMEKTATTLAREELEGSGQGVQSGQNGKNGQHGQNKQNGSIPTGVAACTPALSTSVASGNATTSAQTAMLPPPVPTASIAKSRLTNGSHGDSSDSQQVNWHGNAGTLASEGIAPAPEAPVSGVATPAVPVETPSLPAASAPGLASAHNLPPSLARHAQDFSDMMQPQPQTGIGPSGAGANSAMTTGTAEGTLGGMTTMAMTTVAAPTTTSPGLLDLSVLDSLDTDIDLFGNFDPSFDLGAIDTALEANLDMGIPQNWGPWNNGV